MDRESDRDELEALTEFLYVVPVGLMTFGMDGVIKLANPLISQLVMPFLPSGDLSDAFTALAPLMPDITRRVWEFSDELGVVVDHEHCSIVADGRTLVFSVTIHRIHGGANIAILEDITKVAEQEQQLFEDRQRFMAIFDNVRDYAIYTTDLEGRVDEWNQSLRRYGEWDAERVVGQPLTVFFLQEEGLAARIAGLLKAALQKGSVETEGWGRRNDGTAVWTNTVITVLPDTSRKPRGFVVVSRDMTERKHAEDELRRLATTDPLTGAYNRRHGQDCLAKAFPRNGSGEGVAAVLMLDIDRFKSINDRHGHDVGDVVLCEAVDVCWKVLGDAGSVVRWGGEELLAILPDCSAEAAVEVAERIRSAIAEVCVNCPSGDVGMTVSIGVARDEGRGPEDVLRQADAALYAAKRAGRDRVIAAPTPPFNDRLQAN